MGLIAPAGIPDAMVERINHLVGEAITSPAIREKLAAQLMEPIPDTPARIPRPHRCRYRALEAGDRGGENQDRIMQRERIANGVIAFAALATRQSRLRPRAELEIHPGLDFLDVEAGVRMLTEHSGVVKFSVCEPKPR